MEQGWVWDLDDFAVNQIGHPYQGNNYFNTGRANGLSFYESAAVTAFGSATWEYFGETNHASLNDFINTTLGGIALGEMFHRTAWLVRNTRATGRGRLWSEIGATALDPITGVNRFIRGDASRVTDKPADMVPSNLTASGAAGVLWRGTEDNAFTADAQPFVEVDAIYGDPDKGHSRTPFDAFAMKLRFGGGSGLSEARVRGRLLGQPLKDDKLQFSVVQSYDFQKNDAYATGSQSFEAAFGFTQNLSSTTRFWMLGWGGLTVLGAIDSLPLGLTEIPEEEESGDAGQGVSEGPRYYDYGPGAELWRDRHLLAEQSPVRDALLRGPSPLLPRRRAREPLPAARTRRPPAATARCVRRGRHRRVLRSTDVLPGRRPHARQTTATRRCAPTSHGGCREPLDAHLGARPLPARACPGHGVRPGSPPGTVEPTGRRRLERVVRGRRRVRDNAGRLSDLRGGLPVPPLRCRAGRHRISCQSSHGRRRRSVLDADRDLAGNDPHHTLRCRGAVQALGLAGVLPERRRRDGVRPELGGRPRFGLVQREGPVRGQSAPDGPSGRPVASACRCSARSTPSPWATCRPARG